MVEEREVTPILKVEGLTKVFDQKSGKKRKSFKALDDVSFSVQPGKTLGIVGESGCGKSTLGRVILRLLEPTAGQAWLNGENIFQADPACLKRLRRNMQIIFQDPYSSLNPRMTVGQIIGEGLMAHNIFKKGDPKMQDYIMEIMEKCGLASYFIHRYPHQFSGGQRQRIGIARSLAVHPKFVVCDEAVSALDVSIQSQIINLLLDLKEQNNLTYLFISHDLSVIKYISDRIGVMYLGNMMELSDTEHLFAHPYHPYTEALLSAIPTTDVDGRKETIILEGDIPSPINPPKGCKFHTRCRYCTEICKNVTPQFEEVEPGHFVACHHKLGVPEEK